MSQHTNKWGWQGYNCKMRPAGSGTTHSTRREQRKALQWDQLAANHQPDTEDSLEKQLEALEKAAQKAKEKMEELKEKKKGKRKRRRRRKATPTTIPQLLQKSCPKRERTKQSQGQSLWKRTGPGLCLSEGPELPNMGRKNNCLR